MKSCAADPVKTKGRRIRFDELLARCISPSDVIPNGYGRSNYSVND